ncbi:unnamed protein product [Brachionus calyciflorus]|uniref:Uncharacterized protein n=1 Tax=Brachionus calyciflorus TaxID=104777 RepID=A0A813NEA1_9BILA|nr:unnamed protein product [Brachionus calyciflorus]
MKNFLITTVLLALALLFQKINSLKCYSCEGYINDLKNVTCFQTAENDTCYISVSLTINTKNWWITLTSFQEPKSPDIFPNNYIKPQSGSDFAEINYQFTDNMETNQVITARYFCYTDHCNQLSMAYKLIAPHILYENIPMKTPIVTCLQCNGPTYESVKNCKLQRFCFACNLSSNRTGDGLFSFLPWSSECSNNHAPAQPNLMGFATLQYEFQTKLLYNYIDIICYFEECNTFDYMNRLSQSFEIIF